MEEFIRWMGDNLIWLSAVSLAFFTIWIKIVHPVGKRINILMKLVEKELTTHPIEEYFNNDNNNNDDEYYEEEESIAEIIKGELTINSGDSIKDAIIEIRTYLAELTAEHEKELREIWTFLKEEEKKKRK